MPAPIAEPISSTDNAQVKLARSLLAAGGRRKHGAFLVEGLRLVEAAVGAAHPQLVLHSADFGATDEREAALLGKLARGGAPVRPVTDRVLAHVTDTVTPQGIVAVMPLPEPTVGAPVQRAALHVILDQVGDPGNAGTLLRSAAAAGVTRILAAPGTVDLFAPKVVRSAAGAHFQVPVARLDTWDAIKAVLPGGMPIYLTDAHGGRAYWDVDWTGEAALIVSSEAHGASDRAQRLATETVTIPMAAGVESLNAGVAGSIILFEALRQRTTAGR